MTLEGAKLPQSTCAETPPSTWREVLQWRAFHQPDRCAFRFLDVDTDEVVSLTYSDLDRKAIALAAKLQSMEAPGMRALLLYPPGLDYITAIFGCLYAGVVAVPVYPPRNQRTLPRLHAIVADAGAAVALSTRATLPQIQQMFANTTRLQWLATDDLDSGLEAEWRPPVLSGDSLAFLQYTSGSTSVPKGVMISHRNLLHNSTLLAHAFQYGPATECVTWLPLYHDMGLIGGVFQPLYGGFRNTLMSPLAFLRSPFRWLKAISDYKATLSGGPNFAYDLCARRITAEQRETLDLSHWSIAFTGAEPVQSETLQRFVSTFAPCGFRREAFFPCYGLAEATLIVSGGPKAAGATIETLRPAELAQNRIVRATPQDRETTKTVIGCGMVLPDEEVLVVHPRSRIVCAPHEVGEIWVSSQSVARGYWNRPDETNHSFEARLATAGAGPFLRTGDLGYIHDGELFITGRLKDLIIIRGRNLYPQDVELTVETCHVALRPNCGAAFTVEVDREERLVIVHEVEPQERANLNALIETIRQAVAEEFEVQPYVVVLIKPKSIPKTSSGKIQRHACRARYLAGDLEMIASVSHSQLSFSSLSREALLAAAPPLRRRLLNEYLQERIARGLGVAVSRLNWNQPLISLGLDSLMAVELQAEVESALDVLLPMARFMQASGTAQLVTELLELLSQSSPEKLALPAPSYAKDGEHPLSPGQKGLWFLQQLDPSSVAYNIARAVRVRSALDAGALRRAFQALVERHDSLRATFTSLNGEPVQVINQSVEVCFVEYDATKWSESVIDEKLCETSYRPFDLECGPLLHVHLFRRSAAEHILLLVAHHLIVDFWSLALMMQELAELYSAEQSGLKPVLPPPSLDYVNYAHWQTEKLAGSEFERHWEYWRQQLSGDLPVLDLPIDKPRPPTQTYRGASHSFRIKAEHTRMLKQLGVAQGATLYTVLLAAFQTLLHRYTGQAEIIVGSPVNGRNRSELMSVVGYFINVVALRTNFSDDPNFYQLLSSVRQTVVSAFEYQEYPFTEIVERLKVGRDFSRSPIFQSMFVMQKAPGLCEQGFAALALGEAGARLEIGGMEWESLALAQRVTQFDLTLTVSGIGDELAASLEYNTDLFESETLERMSKHFERLVEEIVTAPERRLSELELLSEGERRQLLCEWNATDSDYPREQCLHELFEEQVRRSAGSVALVFGGEEVSYAELNRRANQLAHYLRQHGVGPEILVGVLLERSVELVVAVLGVLKAGGAYVPLEPSYPKQRLAFMLADIEARVLLTQRHLVAELAETEAQIVCLDEEALPEKSVLLDRRLRRGMCGEAMSPYSAWAAPPVGAWPPGLWAKGRTMGAAQTPAVKTNGRAEPDLTSGGEAATDQAQLTFRAKPDEDCEQFGEQSEANPARLSEANPARLTEPENLAYVIYTSGSTGKPKGVQITHRGILNFLAAMGREPGLSAGDVFLSVTNLSFDIAGLELFLPLLTGARVVVASREEVVDGSLLMARLETSGATVMQATPATWRLLLEAGWKRDKRLRVLCGGEALGAKLAEQLIAGGGEVWNLYGPTETTVWSTISRIESGSPVTIGRPIANTQCYVLDEHGEPVAVGVAGELYLGGAGLARGYLKRPELTAEKFVANPFSSTAGARLYRTGDLVRYRRTGELEYLGRLDQQVKVRGYRIELGEIEAALLNHAAVNECAVIARHEEDGEQRLVGYVVVEGEWEQRELREHLRQRLPEYMIPSVFVRLEELPLTANGKVDRRALPVPAEEVSRDSELASAVTAVEEVLLGIWQEVLRVQAVGLGDNFFELGGHSLLATQLLSRVRAAFGVELGLRKLFEAPTVAGLAAEVEQLLQQGAGVTAPPLRKALRGGLLPLSFAQQRLWFIDRLEGGSSFYNLPVAVALSGELQVEALERTLTEVVRRHEVLRTHFAEVDGEPVQVIEAAAAVRLAVTDLSGLGAAEREAEVQRQAQAEAAKAFDLSTGPVLRVQLLRLAETEHVVLLTLHHIVSDNWSMGVLIRELSTLYKAFTNGSIAELPELSIQYADYAAWQRKWLREEVLEKQLAYWKQQLGDELPILELPADFARPALSTQRGAISRLRLNAETSERLKELSRREGVTLFMTLLGGLDVLLSRYTGQQNIVIASPIAGRNRLETEELIGFFVNTLLLRTDLSDDPTFRELLKRLRDLVLGAQLHQDLPFERLVEELRPERNMSHTPLFKVMFALQNAPQSQLDLGKLQLRRQVVVNETAKFDLTIVMEESPEGLEATFNYNSDLFAAATIDLMTDHFRNLLEAVIENPDRHVSELPLTRTPELKRLVHEWNDTTRAYPRESCVHELFAQQAERTPEAVAVSFGAEQLTYAELNARANQLAHYLRSTGVEAGKLVGIYMDRATEMVVAVLGVLKAGAAYVPIDPEYPPGRLQMILDDAGVTLVLTQERLQINLLDSGVVTVCLDAYLKRISRGENTSLPVTPQNLAYVIYTSGSTGTPKGIKIAHRALVNYVWWAREVYQRGEPQDFALYSSLSFDLTVTSIYVPLLSGGRVVVYRKENGESPLLRILEEDRVDVLKLTPSHLTLIKDRNNEASRIKRLIVGGEALLTELARQIYESFGGKVEIYNEYGPTEATVGCMLYRYQPEVDKRAFVPIGRPAANVQIYVLDKHGRIAPQNVVGELCISGDGLAQGYLNRESLTAARFVAHPFIAGRKLYRSGDRARLLPEGEIEYLGRQDEQVKFHGYRVELNELRSVVNQHPQIRDSVVLLLTDERGAGVLVAYYVSRQELDLTSLREFLARHLIQATIPGVFVHLKRVPLTVNGKINYQALPSLAEARKQLNKQHLAPQTAVEEILSGIWSEVLGLDHVGTMDNFFAIGGHSLLATKIVSRIRETLHVEVMVRTLFDHPTIRSLSKAIEEQSGLESAPVLPIPRADRERPLPLSFAQQRLWFLDQLNPGSAAYNVAAAARLIGTLNVAALQRSVNSIVERHESLRTRFIEIDGEPVQVIGEQSEVQLPLTDLSHLTKSEREAETQRLIKAEARLPFELSRTVIRGALLKLSEEEHVLLLTMHHIVSDWWSMRVLIREFGVFYSAFTRGTEAKLPALPIQYADYAAWQRDHLQGPALQEELDYWKQQLSGELPVLALPQDYQRPPVQTYRGAEIEQALDTGISRQLKELSRREGVTLFMTLLAAFEVLLARYTRQQDILVGTPIAARNSLETEALIGFFANTLVLRINLSGNPSFRDLLQRVREVTLAAQRHQNLPFEKLVEELQPERDLSHSPLFQVMFAFENTPHDELEFEELRLRREETASETAKFDLLVTLKELKDGLLCAFNYDKDLFESSTIERMMDHFQNLLAAVVAEPERRISELSLSSAGERLRVLEEWNATGSDYPHEQCLQELFEAQVRRSAESVALVFGEEEISYEELNGRANQLAHFLRQQGVGPEILVGILLERSVELVVAVLGVLKAGGAYVPLDPSYPLKRLRFMLEDAAVPVLLTQRALLAQVPASAAKVIALDQEWEQIAGQSAKNPPPLTQPDNLAYVIYTSGSTGQPKGVAVEHHSAVTLLHWAGNIFTPPVLNGMLASTSLGFDLSVFELFLPLGYGGRIVLVQNALELAQLRARADVRLLNTVPSVASELVRNKWIPPSVRVVNLAGETLGRRLVEQLYEHEGIEAVYNLYGPTEGTVYSTYALLGRGDKGAPVIGRPITGTQCYVLDEHGEPVAVGVAGELYLGGAGLARGYLKHPELTAEKFVANPFSSTPGARLYRTGDLVRYRRNGELEYLGRLDQQVKLRGYRIELGEIEAALLSEAGVRECVVVARNEGDGEQRLVGYVVAESEWEQRGLREHLRQRLPEYMIPSVFVRLEELPLTANGKLDRRALPAPAEEVSRDTELTSAVTAVEEVLLGIWQEVLRVKAVGVTDNFFELGGHSLLATQLLSRVRAAFGVELGLRKLFEAPTVAGLAAEVEQLLQQGAGVAAPPLRKALRAGPLPLSFAQQRLWFIDRLEGGSSFYNLPMAVALNGELQVEALERTLTEVVRRHEVLRTHFAEVNGEPVQVIEAAVALRLVVTDLSELAGPEREAEARRLAQVEAAKAFDLSTGPLLRVQLLRLAETEHVVLLTLHHIITDGWSTGVLIREVATLYRAYQAGEASPLAELPIQYGDYAAWQREWLHGEALEAQLRYWRRQLGGELPVLELPADRPRPAVQSYRGRQRSFSLAEDLSRAVKELSRREGVTLFMTLLAGFQTLLYRYTQEDDLLIGTAIAGRTQKETEPLLGCFVNTLVLRTDLSGNPKFSKLLRRVREVSLSAYAHQEAPFEKLVEELQPERSLSHTPLFQVAFGVQNTPALALELPGLKLSTVTAPPQLGRFELTVWVMETSSGLRLSWSYNTDLFDESRIERMHRHYETLLQSIVANPDERLNSLNSLTVAEQAQQAAEQDIQQETSLTTLMNTRRRSQVTCSVPLISQKEQLDSQPQSESF